MATQTRIVVTCDLCATGEPVDDATDVTLALIVKGPDGADLEQLRGAPRRLDVCGRHRHELLTLLRWYESAAPLPAAQLEAQRTRRRRRPA